MSFKLPKQIKRWCEKAGLEVTHYFANAKCKNNWNWLLDPEDNCEYYTTLYEGNLVLNVYTVEERQYAVDYPKTEKEFVDFIKYIKSNPYA